MKILAEAVAFTGMAVALHLGGLALATLPSGAPGSLGAGGADLVTLRGADSDLAATVARWTEPPTTQDHEAVPARAPEAKVAAARVPSVDVAPPGGAAAPLGLPDARSPLLPRKPLPPPRPIVALLHEAVGPAPMPDAPTISPEDATRERPPDPEPLERTKPADLPAKVPPPPAPPQAAHSPAPVLRAAGQGGGVAAGVSGIADTPSLSPGDLNGLLAAWGARIRMAVERQKHYPRAAGGATGTATVEISVIGDGRVQRTSLRQSAGHPALDHAALAAVRAAGRFPAAPEGLDPGPHAFSFQMVFDP